MPENGELSGRAHEAGWVEVDELIAEYLGQKDIGFWMRREKVGARARIVSVLHDTSSRVSVTVCDAWEQGTEVWTFDASDDVVLWWAEDGIDGHV